MSNLFFLLYRLRPSLFLYVDSLVTLCDPNVIPSLFVSLTQQKHELTSICRFVSFMNSHIFCDTLIHQKFSIRLWCPIYTRHDAKTIYTLSSTWLVFSLLYSSAFSLFLRVSLMLVLPYNINHPISRTILAMQHTMIVSTTITGEIIYDPFYKTYFS